MNEDIENCIKNNRDSILKLNNNIDNLNYVLKNLVDQFSQNQRDISMLKQNFNKIIIKDTTIVPFLINLGVWILVGLLFIFSSFILQLLPQNILSCLDKYTSWLTFVAIISCGLVSSTYLSRHNMTLGLLVSVAWASIFICYFGYVTMDYGSLHPHIAAIGFNISTILQSVAILFVSFVGFLKFIIKNIRK